MWPDHVDSSVDGSTGIMWTVVNIRAWDLRKEEPKHDANLAGRLAAVHPPLRSARGAPARPTPSAPSHPSRRVAPGSPGPPPATAGRAHLAGGHPLAGERSPA